MRHEHHHGPDGASRADGGRRTVHRRAAGRLDRRRRRPSRNDDAGFWLDSDRFGDRAVQVRLRPADACGADDGEESKSDEPAWRRFDRPVGTPGLRPTRTYLSDSACVTYDITPQAGGQTIDTLDQALAFQPRSELAAEVHRRSGLTLCGAPTPRCVGESE